VNGPDDVYVERKGYEAKDRQVAERRNERWRDWSNSPEAAVARQRRHRLLAPTRREQFADADTDPLELGKEALDKLHRVRQGLGHSDDTAYLEEACELVKQLAWGPLEDPRAVKPAAPVSDLTTPAGRGRLGQHRRWHASGKRQYACRSRPST
jgi:hypothetical protein